MTRTTNARIAGFTFLFYIAVGIASMILFGKAVSFSAVVLAVTLYGIARDEDHELAVVVLACRVGEGARASPRPRRDE